MSATLSRWRAFAGLLWSASPGGMLGFGTLVLVAGLLPTGVILATGALIRAIPGVVEHGLAGTAAVLALAMSRIQGMKLTLATPAGYGVDPQVLATAQSLAQAYGATIEETHDIDGVESGYDVVYTSRWQEMGVGKADPAWKTHFHPFRVTQALMDRVGGEGAVFMHDLPALRGEDVDDEVLDGARSLAWVQAQYKMWSAMAVMEWCGAGVVDDDR